MTRRILYYGGCWPTNIGNAFIDLGAMACMRRAFPGYAGQMLSEYPRWSFQRRHGRGDALDLLDRLDIDVVFVSGMTCCDEFVETEGVALLRARERGVEVVFNGCGQLDYDAGETRRFRAFLERLDPLAFVSRDRASYENVADVCPRRLDGIDCGFFLPEAYTPPAMRGEPYAVVNFDEAPAPELGLDLPVLRAQHAAVENLPEHALAHPDTLVSDVPEDYLALYAGCRETHSDRVHACVATLAYGNAARLYAKTPRAGLFQRVGGGAVGEELVRVDLAALGESRDAQVAFLAALLAER